MTKNQNIAVRVEGERKAFESLAPQLEQQTMMRRITVDVQQAAYFVASVGRKIAQSNVRARFARLPPEEFDIAHIDNLESAAKATLYAFMRHADASAIASRAKVSADLLEEAVDTKARMYKVLEYNLGHDPVVGTKLADIREGQGYADLALDLSRMSLLYVEHQSVLVADNRFYRPADSKLADELAQRIGVELGDGRAGDEQVWMEALQQAWTFMVNTYDEVGAAGRWLFRHEDADAMFPSLFAVVRSKRRTDSSASTTSAVPISGPAIEPTADIAAAPSA